WRRALHDGTIEGTTLPTRTLSLSGSLAETSPASTAEGIEVKFRPDPTIYDGRFVNNGWLQELPKPISKLTWDNAVMLSPATASSLGVSNGDVVELANGEFTVRAPVWVMAGHADNSATVTLGYGGTRVGRVGEGLGFNAYAIRTSAAPWIATGVQIRPTGETYKLATTQAHHQMHDRPIVQENTLEGYRKHPTFSHIHIPGTEAESEEGGQIPSLYPEYEYTGYRWGMTIDLTTCIGCNACTVACQAENNIPIVGKEEIMRSREMHWLRVDTYFQGEPGNPDAAFHMPVPCMHCEKAPCEPVCPVAATVHDAEGLNNMVYNRCVGTRYCSNNCPYKVRRFNFLEYMDDEAPILSMLRNPDVTIRSRGVMEKCTYCIQRISSARIEAQKEGRSIREGEVITACQAACAVQAIIFGDINNEESAVLASKAHPLNYALLADLGTQPRTTYLGAVRNPNPELSQEEG
nr:4Fe-4S dicluster domain-containing protein [Ardenticatenales bacterium]